MAHMTDEMKGAVEGGDWAAVRRLIDQGADPRSVDGDGCDALMLAASMGHAKAVSMLLPVCDPRAEDENGYDALMWAARGGDAETVGMLLPVSDPLAVGEGGWTALMLAAWEGHAEVVELLLPHGDPMAADKHGRAALMWARDQRILPWPGQGGSSEVLVTAPRDVGRRVDPVE